MQNWTLWLSLITTMGGIVARGNGAAPRELAYLQLLSQLATLSAATDADLEQLHAKYTAEVEQDLPTSQDELQQIADRINARGLRIQEA